MDAKKVQIKKDAEILGVGDLHGGCKSSLNKKFLSMLDYVLEKENRYIIITGDLAEGIIATDKRFTIGRVDYGKPDPLEQLEWLATALKEVADQQRILLMLTGNHELTLEHYGTFTKHLCKDLGILDAYGGYTSVVTINDSFKIWAWHGRGMIQSQAYDPIQAEANEKKALKDKLKYKYGEALVQMTGHYHKMIIYKPIEQLYLYEQNGVIRDGYLNRPTLGSGTGFIHPDQRWYCCTGCFKKMYVPGTIGYEEVAGLNPTQIGYIKMTIRNSQLKDIEKVPIFKGGGM